MRTTLTRALNPRFGDIISREVFPGMLTGRGRSNRVCAVIIRTKRPVMFQENSGPSDLRHPVLRSQSSHEARFVLRVGLRCWFGLRRVFFDGRHSHFLSVDHSEFRVFSFPSAVFAVGKREGLSAVPLRSTLVHRDPGEPIRLLSRRRLSCLTFSLISVSACL